MNQKLFYIILSVVVLSIILGFVITFILEIRKEQKSLKNMKYPPLASKCPDYWEVLRNGNCRNNHSIGLCKTSGDRDMNFNDDLFKGKAGDNYKCAWAKQCQVPWQGIDQLC